MNSNQNLKRLNDANHRTASNSCKWISEMQKQKKSPVSYERFKIIGKSREQLKIINCNVPRFQNRSQRRPSATNTRFGEMNEEYLSLLRMNIYAGHPHTPFRIFSTIAVRRTRPVTWYILQFRPFAKTKCRRRGVGELKLTSWLLLSE